MDIVSLLFYPSWLNALRDEGRMQPGAAASNEDRCCHSAIGGAPEWRHVLAPFAVPVILVLAVAFFRPGA